MQRRRKRRTFLFCAFFVKSLPGKACQPIGGQGSLTEAGLGANIPCVSLNKVDTRSGEH